MTYQNLTIKTWAVEDRPREKMRLNGSQSLSDAELLGILIGSGNRDSSAVELGRQILNNNNNDLYQLGKLSIDELKKQVKGIGEAKAITIMAALELGRRRKLSDISEKLQISCSRDAYNILHPLMEDLPHEEVWVLYLNRANKVIDKRKLHQGGVAGTVMDVKIIMKEALNRLASSVILAHNHPSGNIVPSAEDIRITDRIKKGGEVLEVAVLDHLIIGERSYYSFADEGKL